MSDSFSGSGAGTGAGIGGAVGGGLGDIIGYFLSQGDRDTARKLLGEATQGTEGLNPNVATFTAQTDPTTRAMQLQALDELHGIWSNQGLDPIAKAQIAQAQLSSEQQANAQNNAVMGQAAQRGMLDSGTALAAERSNAQAAANRGAMSSMEAAAGGEQRGMQALGQYQQGAQEAERAQDAINRFNAANSQAQAQQNYQNAMGKNAALAGYGNEYSGWADKTQKQSQAAGQGIGAGVGGAIGGLTSIAGAAGAG